MTESFRRSGEPLPPGPGISEHVITDPAYAADEERPGPSHRHGGPRPSGSAPDTPAVPTRSGRNRSLLLTVAVVGLGLAAVVGVRYYTYLTAHEGTDDAFIEGHIVQISPKVAGHVLRVYVTDNQEVHQGDLLLEIDPRDYAARLTQARAVFQATVTKRQAAQSSMELTQVTADAGIQQAAASVELAKSAVQTARAQVVTARSRLEQARAQVDTLLANAAQARAQVVATEAEMTRADTDVKRTQELYSGAQIVSRRDLDHATKDARVAAAQLEAARKKVLAADAQVAEARAAQQTAMESLHSMESQVLEAQARVGEALGRLAAAQAAPYQVAVSQANADTASAEVTQARAAVERAELELARRLPLDVGSHLELREEPEWAEDDRVEGDGGQHHGLFEIEERRAGKVKLRLGASFEGVLRQNMPSWADGGTRAAAAKRGAGDVTATHLAWRAVRGGRSGWR